MCTKSQNCTTKETNQKLEYHNLKAGNIVNINTISIRKSKRMVRFGNQSIIHTQSRYENESITLRLQQLKRVVKVTVNETIIRLRK